jgi:hypothetical protein
MEQRHPDMGGDKESLESRYARRSRTPKTGVSFSLLVAALVVLVDFGLVFCEIYILRNPPPKNAIGGRDINEVYVLGMCFTLLLPVLSFAGAVLGAFELERAWLGRSRRRRGSVLGFALNSLSFAAFVLLMIIAVRAG